MHVFFIIILVYKVTKAENRETRYIDLLPEKEKEDFLDTIARRILSEVQTTDDRPRASVELTDDVLNQHDEFVNQILKEETQNLRKQANDTNSPNKGTTTDMTLLPKDRNENINNDDRYVDLTLRFDTNRNKRENKRRVFTVFSPDNSTENDNESDESDGQDIQVKNFNRKSNVVTRVNNNEEEISSQAKEKSEGNEKITQFEANIENESKEKDSSEKENNKLLEIVVTTENINAKNSVESIKAGADNGSKENENDKSVNYFGTNKNRDVKINIETTETIQNDSSRVIRSYENPQVDNKYIKSSEVNSDNTAADRVSEGDTKVVNIEITPATATNTQVDNEQMNISEVNSELTVVNTASEGRSKIVNIKMTPATEITKVIDTGTSSIAKNVDVAAKQTATRKTNDNNETNYTIISTEPLTNTPSPIINDSESNDKLKATGNKNMEPEENKVQNEPVEQLEKSDDSENSKNIANEIETATRQNLLNSINLKDNSVDAQTTVNNLKEYEVYEISADVDPFVKQKLAEAPIKSKENLRTKEEPYEVPIYSYIPENAFYNSRNIFGPNDSDNENGSQDNDFSVVKQNYPVKTKPTKKAPKEEEPFYVPVYNYSPNDAFYNPYNYFGLNPEFNEKNGKEENYVEYNDDSWSYAIDKYDDERDSNDKYDSDDIEAEYKLFNDPHLRFRPVDFKRPKANKNVPFRLNLPVAAHYPKLKDIVYSPNDYFDTYIGRKDLPNLRCQRSRCSQKNTSEAQTENSSENSYQVPDSKLKIPNPQHQDNVSLIRQLLLEKKYFGFAHPFNKTKVTSSIESEDDEEERQENKPGGRTKMKKHNPLMDILGKTKYYSKYVTKKERPRSKNQNIANYYFGGIKSEDDIVRHIEKVYLPKHTDRNKKKDFRIPLYLDNYYNHKINSEVKSATPTPFNRLKSKKTYKNTDKNDLINTLVDIFPEVDIENMLLKMEKFDKSKRQKSREMNSDLNEYVTVLGDMIEEKNKGLRNYDWLRTTVDLQGSKAKIVDMIRAVKNNQEIHPSDVELLKYIVFLHSSAKKELEDETKKKLRALFLPRSKKKKGAIKESGLLNRVWLMRIAEDQIPYNNLEDLEEFLDDMQTAFYDLHTAVKYIAMITPYKKQNWFENLRQIHIDVERKQLLQVILHLTTTRLLGLIEETVQNGREDNFLAYLMAHEKEVARTIEEFVFVLKLLNELKHF